MMLTEKKKQQLLIGLIGIFGVSFLWNVEIQPNWKKYELLKSQLITLMQEEKELKQYALFQDQFEKQQPIFERKNKQLHLLLPDHWDFEGLLGELLTFQQQVNVQLLHQRSEPEVKLNHYAQFEMEIELEGKYLNLIQFLKGLPQLNTLSRITHLKVDNLALDEVDPQLRLDIKLLFFRRLPNEPQQTLAQQ